MQYALDRGVIVCAAAGNVVLAESWLTAVTYPAAYPGVIAVAGCDYFYRPWRDTCRGKEVVVTAPGTDVWRATAELDGFWPWEKETVFSTGQGSGTSFAVATVAGIAACWLNYWGGWDSLLQKLGDNPRSIPEAFLECIHQHNATIIDIPNSAPPDLPDYPNFQRQDFGKGVINAQELVKIDPLDALKQKQAAVALPLVASVSDVSVADKILSDMLRLLPRVEIEKLRSALASDLGLPEAKLDKFLESHGRELLHHAVTSSALRTRLREITEAQPPSPVAAATAFAVMATAVPFYNDSLITQLSLRGSDELRKDLL